MARRPRLIATSFRWRSQRCARSSSSSLSLLAGVPSTLGSRLGRHLRVVPGWLLLGLSLLLPPASGALPPAAPDATHENPDQRFQDQVAVREVLVDVLVTDASGSVVLGLGPEDFVVTADGQRAEVSAVTFYSSSRLLSLPGEAPQGELPRLFTLAFVRPAGAREPGRVIRFPLAGERGFRWAVEDLLPGDRIAAVAFDGLRLRIAHDFTTDRSRLGQALRQAALGQLPKRRWPSRTETPEAGISLAAYPGLETASAQEETLGAALQRLAAALGGVAGRKNLVLLGAEPPRPGSPRWQEEQWDDAVEALNAHNVAVYGLPVERRGRSAGLDHLAEATGGLNFFRFESLDDPLRRIARETSGYYLLSVEPLPSSNTASDPDGDRKTVDGTGRATYRTLTVRTVHPHLEARARGGFRGPALPTTDRTGRSDVGGSP